MDVTYVIGSLNLSKKLSTFSVDREIKYRKTIITLDDVEHNIGGSSRPIVTASFLPLTDAEVKALYDELSKFTVPLTYTDPYIMRDVTRRMSLSSDLSQTFGLKSINGNWYYKGGNVILRQV